MKTKLDDEGNVITVGVEESDESVRINLSRGKDEGPEIKNPVKSVDLGGHIHRLQSHPVNDTVPELKSDALYYTVTSFEVVEKKFNSDRTGIIFIGENRKEGEEAEIPFDERKKSARKADKYFTDRQSAVLAAKELTEAELDRAQEQLNQYQDVVNILRSNLENLRF
jgi:hypothetical protein